MTTFGLSGSLLFEIDRGEPWASRIWSFLVGKEYERMPAMSNQAHDQRSPDLWLRLAGVSEVSNCESLSDKGRYTARRSMAGAR